MFWNSKDHPRAAAGTFTDKPQSPPEATLSASTLLASATTGRVTVAFSYTGNGSEDETPNARVDITVAPEKGKGAPTSYGFETRAPAYLDEGAFQKRAADMAWNLHLAGQRGGDLDALASTYAQTLDGAEDALIAPPETNEDAARMFAGRDLDGRVLGWYVTEARTGRHSFGPFTTQGIAEVHVPVGVNGAVTHRVKSGPVTLADGTVAVAP